MYLIWLILVWLPNIKSFKGMKLMIEMDCVHLVGMLVIGFFW